MLYNDDVSALSFLPSDDFKAVILAAHKFSSDGELPKDGDLSPAASSAFCFLLGKLVKDEKRYREVCAKRSGKT